MDIEIYWNIFLLILIASVLDTFLWPKSIDTVLENYLNSLKFNFRLYILFVILVLINLLLNIFYRRKFIKRPRLLNIKMFKKIVLSIV